jgi:hypothetical protein
MRIAIVMRSHCAVAIPLYKMSRSCFFAALFFYQFPVSHRQRSTHNDKSICNQVRLFIFSDAEVFTMSSLSF